MNKKVLLINSPTIRNQYTSPDNYFPLGLLSLGTTLKKNNYDASIIDINNIFYLKDFDEHILEEYIRNDLLKHIGQVQPDVIGIGCIFSGAFRSLRMIASAVKKAFPQIPVVVGGIHATIFAKEMLDTCGYVDYVIIGEGENSFLELVKRITGGNQSVQSIDGIAFRDTGGTQVNPKKQFINNLDDIPFLDYSLLNIDEYKMDTSWWFSPKKLDLGQPFPIISSRSCPERCSFCSMWMVHGKHIRFRSADNVLDEIEHLYDTYNARMFHFMDDNMTFSKKRTLELCDGILKRNLNIQFDPPNGLAVKRLDQEIIDALVGAGMARISIAIETGSEYIRNEVMKKGLKNEKIMEVAEQCARHSHLFVQAFFIVGMPQETRETLEETFQLIKSIPLDKIGIFYATPYPGTELFDYCIKHKLMDCNADGLIDVEHLQHLSDRPHFKPHGLTMEDLAGFRKKCYDYMDEKRRISNIPNKYPLRYKDYGEDISHEREQVEEYTVSKA